MIGWEIYRKDALCDTVFKLIIDIAGIVVTVISIFVTILDIRRSMKNDKHQKSNRPRQG